MAGLLSGDPLQHGMYEGGGSYNNQSEDGTGGGGQWYYSRKEIEENSSSRRDGIDLKKETYMRKSYCTFLQDLGMRLKVPQVTIATAIIFCHRFFLRQSHARNDRRTIATVCMFLAGKVEETPRPLKDVILVSYEIIHRKDPAAAQRIKQKEVYEQQKELILMGERVVLATLGFDLNVHHPYKPLVEAIKKFGVAQNALAQVAWNFVNDGLRTSLCLQFKPHHIAAGAIFLAAKFLKVKLPNDPETSWWREFDVHPAQLEEVSNQMLELYEQNRLPNSQTSEVEGSAVSGPTPRAPIKAPPTTEEHLTGNSNSQGRGATTKAGLVKSGSSRAESYLDISAAPPRTTPSGSNDYANIHINGKPDHKEDNGQYLVSESFSHQGNTEEIQGSSRYDSDGHDGIDQERNDGRSSTREFKDVKDKWNGRYKDHKSGKIGHSPRDAVINIDKNKVKAALEKRKKARGSTTRKTDFTDEDDLIERELEDGIELAVESEKSRPKREQNWSTSEYGNHLRNQDEDGDGEHETKWQLPAKNEFDNVEEGEVPTFGDTGRVYQSPKSNNRKRKAGSPLDRPVGKRHDHMTSASNQHNLDNFQEDRGGLLKLSEKDHKKYVQENYD
ncbi:cyclin-T1-3-like [Apium graveolens]|uniref:cyclin-T1-3-like n=1 Tax=Apium graveolens TaxID=4045 RepID=UPI003D7B7B2A